MLSALVVPERQERAIGGHQEEEFGGSRGEVAAAVVAADAAD